MTKEEMLVEPAGRRLDAWVGIHLFGWRWCRRPDAKHNATLLLMQPPVVLWAECDDEYVGWVRTTTRPGVSGGGWVEVDTLWPDEDSRYSDWDQQGWYWDATYHRMDRVRKRGLPHYSTDIGIAWEVAEKAGRMAIEDLRHDPLSDGSTWLVWRELPNGHTSRDVGATTAPLAICRAALMATLAGEIQ